jgi:DNA polymerase-3 subunit epsilon
MFFDTETTGVPVRGYAPDDDCQPRLVQFAALLIDSEWRERASFSTIVRPDVQIPEGASRIHGITDEIAATYGVPEKAALGVFMRFLAVADIAVAFNASFDREIMAMVAARCRVTVVDRLEWRCACEAATPICDLPPTARMREVGFDKPKKPKLAEAVKILCGYDLEGAHDALADVRGCVAVYRELVARGCWSRAA